MFGSKLPSLIKLPPHNRFDYKPLYYDPEKEKKRKFTEKRISFGEGANQMQNSHISGQFRDRLHWQHKRRLHAQNSSLRVLMMVGILTLPLAYYLDYIGGYYALAGVFLCLFVFMKKLSS